MPPPINGNTKALDTILRSEQCNEILNIRTVNLSGSRVGMSGKFTFQKVKMVIGALKNLKLIQQRDVIDTYYLTIAQSTFGGLRDIALLHQIYKKRDNAKIVLHLHGGGFLNFYKKSSPLIKRLLKKYYSKADIMIVLSQSLRSMFNGIIDDNRIRVVENCVDNDFILLDNIIENKLESIMSKNSLKIVYLSNMIKTKGYLDVLYSAKILFERKIKCKVVFAGDFVNQYQEEEFFEYVKDNNLYAYVEHLGVISGENKKRLLMDGDIFILPTYYPQEGQPISVLEAMSAGMAIITTRHGGIPDVIAEEMNGVFVKAQDIHNISDSIIELVNHPERIVEMGRNNRKAVMENHLEVHYINKLIKILNSC
ncbi:glycosyltransferase family 4 protein [Desulfosporosinus sp. BICA1-9]|uniref:glycosyltransferase family 4 protein n=1 Tax=Desulfosporosinus sp. BICA1-9 TaxID=1531958 RepID=UPI00054C0977|nr:glycosyltransferase family 4 protein [Desulfosporosinus sp. BICA1-9]KJS49024.1 MAG: hypothetical protein VR66_10775 [Peptococcaceae bacterium BRH_c23]KJS90754.1 MAG: hypothetical protein JL57_00070 [Desulfosporosinus sp. BICA1-9]HBW35499.1 hypothetical protein [Desulfosporosinus sp.]